MDDQEKVQVKAGGGNTPNHKPSSSKKVNMNMKTWLVVFVVVASLGAAVYFWAEANDAKNQTFDAQQAQNAVDTERVLNKLNAILSTQSDSEPTVARVEDASLLRESNPDFYKDVIVGDYLVLYPQRAIIYRETENRVINVAPIINASAISPSADNADDIETGDSELEE